MVFSDLQLAVLKTLAYSDQFSHPLTLEELQERLVAGSSTTLSPNSLHKIVSKELRGLVSQKKVIERHGCFALAGRDSNFSTRLEREALSQAKWQEAHHLIEIAKKIPWIKAVAVTGSLAMNNVRSADDDVDFMIVTAVDRLWLTRLWVTLRAYLQGKRRSWHGEEKNSWCFNLWLDEDHLGMPESQQHLYGAYEVIQARWVFDREKVVEARFLKANEWVDQFLPLALEKRRVKSRVSKRHQVSSSNSGIISQFWRWLEKVSFNFQYAYMKPHMTRERVGAGYAFFHPRDTKTLVEQQWQQTLQELTSTSAQQKKPSQLAKLTQLPQKIKVLATGVFDLLHSEHVAFLRKAKAAGDILVVALESDVRVKKMKGPGRPINSQKKRLEAIKKLGIADQVFILPEKFDTPSDHLALLKKIKPDVLAVSAHTQHQDKKAALMNQVGGVLKVVHRHNPHVSTTQILAQETQKAQKSAHKLEQKTGQKTTPKARTKPAKKL